MSGATAGRPSHPALASPGFAPMSEDEARTFDELIDRTLREDIGAGDATTESTVDADLVWHGRIVARADGVVAGLPIAARVFARVDPRVEFAPAVADGTRVARGAQLAGVRGPARALLTGERVALNFLGRLSGIASLTRLYVDAIGSSRAKIIDTRKTTPGLRALERYAVRAGGGVNHRFDLASALLVKDNHIAAVGSIAAAVARARERAGGGIPVEIECDTLEQVREAVGCGAEAVLLDNMDTRTMREAVALCHGKAIVEASGGMSLDRVGEVASTGVDLISVGALTHSAPALDVALDFDPQEAGGRRS